MRKGREIHREKYRPKKVEIDGKKQKYFNIYLISEEYGLAALIDLLIYDDEGIDIVEIKFKRTRSFKFLRHHRMQLVAQAILVEKALGENVRRVGLLYDDVGDITWLKVSDADKLEVLESLKKMRKIVLCEDIPNPTKDVNKCMDCEYNHLCEDTLHFRQ